MLGTRGCRLGIIKPGLYRMQVARARCRPPSTRKQAGGNPIVEIMIPLIVTEPELALLEQWVREEADAVVARRRRRGRLPRRHDDRDAARGARRRRDRGRRRVLLVRHQRPDPDDVRVQPRRRRGPVHVRSTSSTSCSPANPFETLDFEGVGQLVRMGCRARAARPGRTSSSASAVSTAATRRRSRSATSSVSTTCRARRTASRSRASAAAHAAMGSAGPAAPREPSVQTAARTRPTSPSS